MTYEEYRVEAQKTASTKDKLDKIGHGVLGLIGEAGEIVDIIKKRKYMGFTEEMARIKILDEAGDWLWYMAELCTGLEADFEQVMLCGVKYDTDETDANAERLAIGLDYCSLDLWIDNPADIYGAFVGIKLFDASSLWYLLVKKFGLTVQEVMEHNIEKLRARYPKGFDAERSNRRYEG